MRRVGLDALSGSVGGQAAGTGRFGLPLRGRQQEILEIERGFDAAFAGERAVTMFAGDAGIGKTRLLQHAVQSANGRGWSTVIVAPDIDSTMTPFGALIDAVTRAEPPFVTSDEVRQVMGGVSPQYWLTRAIEDSLELASHRSGVLVVVDDLQWLDAASAGAISSLIADLDGVPIYWLLATRSGTHSTAHQRFTGWVAELGATLDLRPLDPQAVGAMARDALGSVPGPKVESAMTRAAGIPLLLIELLRGLREEGLLTHERGMVDIADDRVMPARFGISVRERLRLVGTDALRIAQIASLFGREFPLGGVLDVMGLTTVEAAPAVEELIGLGFIVDTGAALAFSHDTVQAAATDSLSPSLRRALARDVLKRRLDEGESVATLASTISSVAEPGDDDSIDLLLTAAEMLSSTDVQGAAELVVLGARLAAGRTRHAKRVASLLPFVLAGGRLDDATTISSALRPLLGPDARAGIGLAFARRLTESDFTAAIGETTRALGIPGISDETRVQLLAVRALNFANAADADGARQSLDLARATADEERDCSALATLDATESVLTFYEGRIDRAVALQQRAMERVERAGAPAGLWMPEGLWMAFLLAGTGRCDEALRLTDDGLAVARAARNVVAETYWMMVRSRVLYDAGRLDEARTQAETVLDLSTMLGLGDFTDATAGVVLHRIALRTGDVLLRDRMRPLIHRLASGPGLARTGMWSLAVEALDRGLVEEARGHCDLALSTLRDPSPSMTTPADFADDITLAYICRGVDDTDALDLIVDVARRRAELNPDNVLARAVAAATTGIRDGSSADLLDAAELLRSGSRPLITARAFEAAGLVALDDAAAVTALTEAACIFEEHGAVRDASRVLQALRARGVNRRMRGAGASSSDLSVREFQVADRIRAGLTTQQIASELLVSPHTVVTYIRHIYSKWGVNTRREVAERVLDLARPPDA